MSYDEWRLHLYVAATFGAVLGGAAALLSWATFAAFVAAAFAFAVLAAVKTSKGG